MSSSFYVTYGGMLHYLAEEFEAFAATDAAHRAQLERNARLLTQMAAELVGTSAEGAGPDSATATPSPAGEGV